MSYQALIQELLDPKRVQGSELHRAPNSLELRAAKAIYSLLVTNQLLNDKLFSQANSGGNDSGSPSGSSSELATGSD